MEEQPTRTDYFDTMSLMDDIKMKNYFDPSSKKARIALEKMLQIVLEDPTLSVKEFHGQRAYDNSPHRSVVLDVDVIAESVKESRLEVQIDLEMQNDTSGPIEQRTVLNASTLVVHSLAPQGNSRKAEQELRNMPQVIVIVFMLKDHFRRRLPLYRFDTGSKEAGRALKSAPIYIYVNTNHPKVPKGLEELADLIHDVRETKADSMKIPELNQRMMELAMNKESRRKMNMSVQNLIDEAVAKQKRKMDEALAKQKRKTDTLAKQKRKTDEALAKQKRETEEMERKNAALEKELASLRRSMASVSSAQPE